MGKPASGPFARPALLRAVLAFLFLAMASLQPGLLATANAAAFETGDSTALAGQISVNAGHEHGSTGTGSEDADRGHHGLGKAMDECCEAHCTLANALPVGCPDFEPVAVRSFVPAMADAAIPLGESSTPVRPPQS